MISDVAYWGYKKKTGNTSVPFVESSGSKWGSYGFSGPSILGMEIMFLA